MTENITNQGPDWAYGTRVELDENGEEKVVEFVRVGAWIERNKETQEKF